MSPRALASVMPSALASPASSCGASHCHMGWLGAAWPLLGNPLRATRRVSSPPICLIVAVSVFQNQIRPYHLLISQIFKKFLSHGAGAGVAVSHQRFRPGGGKNSLVEWRPTCISASALKRSRSHGKTPGTGAAA